MSSSTRSIIIVAVILALGGAVSYHFLKNQASESVPVVVNQEKAPVSFGQAFGYIKNVEKNQAGETIINFDRAEWFGAAEADTQSKIDYGCANKPKDPVCTRVNGLSPNGFYIRNKTLETIQYRLAGNVTIVRLDNDPTHQLKSTITDLEKIIKNDAKLRQDTPEYSGTPFWLSFEQGSVIEIRQQYVP